jgi:hypothetical protein
VTPLAAIGLRGRQPALDEHEGGWKLASMGDGGKLPAPRGGVVGCGVRKKRKQILVKQMLMNYFF